MCHFDKIPAGKGLIHSSGNNKKMDWLSACCQSISVTILSKPSMRCQPHRAVRSTLDHRINSQCYDDKGHNIWLENWFSSERASDHSSTQTVCHDKSFGDEGGHFAVCQCEWNTMSNPLIAAGQQHNLYIEYIARIDREKKNHHRWSRKNQTTSNRMIPDERRGMKSSPQDTISFLSPLSFSVCRVHSPSRVRWQLRLSKWPCLSIYGSIQTTQHTCSFLSYVLLL